MDPKDCYIYLVTDASGFFSIGCSRNPKRKVVELRRANPTLKLVSTRKVSHGTAYRQRDWYRKRYAHRRVVGEWFSLSDRELTELLGDFDVKATSAAIKQEMSKLKVPVDKRDSNGLKRAFKERFDAAYPAMLRPLLGRLPDGG